MRISILVLSILLISHQSQSQDLAKPTANQPIRVLIIDGFSNHDWKQTTLMVTPCNWTQHSF
jgi:hypothetical protein